MQLDAAAPSGVTVTETRSEWRYQTGEENRLLERTVTALFDGTVTTTCSPSHDETFATTVPNVTVPAAPSAWPLIVSLVPICPWSGDS